MLLHILCLYFVFYARNSYLIIFNGNTDYFICDYETFDTYNSIFKIFVMIIQQIYVIGIFQLKLFFVLLFFSSFVNIVKSFDCVNHVNCIFDLQT